MRSGAFAVIASVLVGGGLSATPQDVGTIGGFPMPELSKYHNNDEVKRDPAVRAAGKGKNAIDTAMRLVKAVAPGAEFRLAEDHYTSSDGITHVYFKQRIHGMDVANGDFNVNVS